MSHDVFTGSATLHDLTVFAASDMVCVSGVNVGEALVLDASLCLASLCLGDTYRLPTSGQGHRMRLRGPDPTVSAHAGYALTHSMGRHAVGTPVVPGPRLNLMCGNGKHFLLKTVQVADEVFLLPLGLIDTGARLTLLDAAPDAMPLPSADPTPLGFATGTRITMFDGRMQRIETLEPGDRVLTRDGGPLEVLCVLSDKVSAIGPMARVVIRPGTLGNDDELVLSASQRVYLPGHRSAQPPHAPNPLPCALELVNGLTITLGSGGQSEYHQIVLPEHALIYAEGVACDSMLLDLPRRAGLSDRLSQQVLRRAAGVYHTPNPLFRTSGLAESA